MFVIFRWVINALALLAVTQILVGFDVNSFYIALIVALILGLINAIIRPILIILTLPITVLTLGLFTFVINAGLLWFVSTFVQGFEIEGFWTALAASIILWAISFLTNELIKQAKKK